MAEEAQTGNSGAGPRGFVGASSHGGEGERLRRTKCTVRGTPCVSYLRRLQTKLPEPHEAGRAASGRGGANHPDCRHPLPVSIAAIHQDGPVRKANRRAAIGELEQLQGRPQQLLLNSGLMLRNSIGGYGTFDSNQDRWSVPQPVRYHSLFGTAACLVLVWTCSLPCTMVQSTGKKEAAQPVHEVDVRRLCGVRLERVPPGRGDAPFRLDGPEEESCTPPSSHPGGMLANHTAGRSPGSPGMRKRPSNGTVTWRVVARIGLTDRRVASHRRFMQGVALSNPHLPVLRAQWQGLSLRHDAPPGSQLRVQPPNWRWLAPWCMGERLNPSHGRSLFISHPESCR